MNARQLFETDSLQIPIELQIRGQGARDKPKLGATSVALPQPRDAEAHSNPDALTAFSCHMIGSRFAHG